MKKAISVIMTFILFVTIAFNNFYVVADEIDETIDDNNVIPQNNIGYLSADQVKMKTNKDIIVDLDNIVISDQPFVFNVNVLQEGVYSIGLSYKAIDDQFAPFSFGFKVDDEFPYKYAENFQIPRMWCDDEAGNRVDDNGNEFAAQQKVYKEYFYNSVVDETMQLGYKYLVYLSVGQHNISIIPKSGTFAIDYFVFESTNEIDKYSIPTDLSKTYSGETIVLEAENAAIKSDYCLVGKNDSSTIDITPNNPYKNIVNYLGGGNWKKLGDTIVLETPELEEGYYNIGFVFRQSSIIGGKTFRSLKIDGVSPFLESETVGFGYDDTWQRQLFSDSDNNAYLFYFSKGKHTISLSVVPGEIADITNKLSEAVAELGELYIDITMITGETVDSYRDYELFKQISDMEERLIEIKELLNSSADILLSVTGQKSGSNYSVIKNMVEIINQMLNNKFESHKYKSSYYTNYCSVSSVLQDLRNMPLDLDKVILSSPHNDAPFQTNKWYQQILFSVKRFFISFIRDYNGVSSSESDNDITVWVNWGRDQAQVLSSLIDRTFTPNSGVNVNLKLVNASIVQAVLSGNGPDCILQHTRSEPVNLAMRGVLYDLSKFDDCEEILNYFQKGAEEPYRYKDGLYALPDTQTFFMMFYRKDILDKFGIEVPKTWEEFDNAAKLLMRNNMSVWLPNNVAMSTAEVNIGVGSVNIFPSLLLQNNVSLYTEDKHSTNLLSSKGMEIFEKWTDYYTKQKFPKTLDFYNRFRIGITPIGISPYTLYTTLSVAAPEIDGLWEFTQIPGTVLEDGSISRASAGGGTACAVLKSSNSPENAWKFIKWWVSSETQLNYSRDVESILGPSGRVALSNIDAIKGLSWSEGKLDNLLEAWSNVREIPECPGSYYVTRSIYQSFWNVVNGNKNTKDTLMKYANEANDEMNRKWKQYQNR